MTIEAATAQKLIEAEPPKPTLFGLLAALKAVDEDMIELNLDEQIDLIDNGRVKVDSYKYVIDKLEVQAIFLKQREEEIVKARKAIENNVKRIKEHLVKALQINGFDKFTGNEYAVTLRKAPPSIELKCEPTSMMKIKFPDWIRTKYEWDKTAVKDALKSGNKEAIDLAGLRETYYPKFSLVRE